MKKYVAFVIFLVIVMFLVGCAKPVAPPEQETTAGDEEGQEQNLEETAEEPEQAAESPEETEAEPQKVLSKEMEKLLQKRVGRVYSMKYMYQDQTNKPEEWETWVMDNKMHIKLREMDNVGGDVYVDHVYLDTATKEAKGYCERKVYRCADPNSPVDVKLAKYYRKTPLEWMDEVTYAERVSEEQMQQRTVVKIMYTEGAKTVYMCVDEYYGVPVKVRVVEGSAVNDYIFEDIAFNSVEDDDLQHRYVSKTY